MLTHLSIFYVKIMLIQLKCPGASLRRGKEFYYFMKINQLTQDTGGLSIIRPKAKSSVNLLISGAKLRNAAKLHPILRTAQYGLQMTNFGLQMPHFASRNTQHLLKITSNSALFPQNPCTIQINALPLQYENPPSLSTMLKCAGRFFICTYGKQDNIQ